MNTIINRTPHDVHLHVEYRDGRIEVMTFPKTGEVVRVDERRTWAGIVEGGKVECVEYGAVEGLPDPQPGVYYIVSGLVLAAAPNRPDLLAPGQPVRDAEGRIVGCKGWTTTPAFGKFPRPAPQWYDNYVPQWSEEQKRAREEEVRISSAKAAYEARKMRDD